MYERHLDDLYGLPVTSGGEYDPAAFAPSTCDDPAACDCATCARGASAGCAPPVTSAGDDESDDDGALSGDVVERVRVGPFTADVQLERREGGLWIACAMISTETGVMSWCGAATEQEVAQRLANRRRHAGATAGAGFDFGSFLNNLGSQIAQGAQQLARHRTLRRVVRDVNTTLRRPELQPVLAVAQQIPYLGQALGAVRAAATMADQVLGGNPQARGRLEGIQRAARQGNPIARQALEVLNDVLRAQHSSAHQRAGGGGSAPPAGGRAPARGPAQEGSRRAPRRGPARGRTSTHRRGPRRRGPTHSPRGGPVPRGPARRGPSRRGAPHPSPLHGHPGRAGVSGAESAWDDAARRWAEHVRQTGGPIVTPPPPAG